jgi:pyrimidine-nucleoside phosphorylase
MQTVEIIRAKRDGQELSDEALQQLVKGYTHGDVTDYQMSAFLMAVFFNGMTARELGTWTMAMLRSGQVLDFSDIPGAKIDKHSTGGVGDKVSLILAPLAVEAGLKVPMISGRGLGHTGGTVDKLTSIPGFDMDASTDRFRQLIEEHECGLIRQTDQIAPADKKLYALRDVTGTVRCIPLIASSIMSKKMAEGIDALVLDIKVGSGAFMRNVDEARVLADTMIEIGAQLDKPVRAVLTDMNQPLGWAVGNALEVQECVEVMRAGEGPQDLIDVTIELVANMVLLADAFEPGEDFDGCKARLREILASGRALARFRHLVEVHGGEPRVCDTPEEVLAQAPHKAPFAASEAGIITAMDTAEVGMAALDLGAGRRTKEDEIDPAVGLVFHKKVGDAVEKGETIATMHYRDEASFKRSTTRLERAISLGQQGDELGTGPLIIETRS